jgi:hypothetical protein
MPLFLDFKDSLQIKQSCNKLITTLRQVHSQSQNKAFYASLQEISEIADGMKYQLDRYQKVNLIRRSMIASDVRQKLRGLCKSLTFNERLIDTYFNGQSQSQLASQHF